MRLLTGERGWTTVNQCLKLFLGGLLSRCVRYCRPQEPLQLKVDDRMSNNATRLRQLAIGLAITIAACRPATVGADDSPQVSDAGQADATAIETRGLTLEMDGNWIGQGVCYGAYRKGQSPGGVTPTRAEVAEDLRLIAKHWSLIRTYGAREVTEQVLQIIHEEKLPIRVMLGVWITRESAVDGQAPSVAQAAKLANRQEVMAGIRLANNYPAEVIAISVGNETQVSWSDHRTAPDVLIGNIRAIRAATEVPVTTADDFNFWNKPESRRIASEVDFIVLHVHAMWAGLNVAGAMSWTEQIYGEICGFSPE